MVHFLVNGVNSLAKSTEPFESRSQRGNHRKSDNGLDLEDAGTDSNENQWEHGVISQVSDTE